VNPWELAANVFNAASIVLAGRNSMHTWWTTIVGCALFGYVFFHARLYADVTLQVFFIGSAVVGWWVWKRGAAGKELPVRHIRLAQAAALFALACLVALGYGWLLYRFTDAAAPFLDSVVLAFSVLGQFLMVGRRVESWWCWLLVNTIAVPLYASRGLYLTAILYVGFWINALVALARWRRLALRP
jgi:nicotinamide mononucleotide transporter